MKKIEPFLILNYYVLKICISMEKGVYVRCYKEENLKQIIFIEVTPIGCGYGRNEYSVKRISFTLVNPETIFQAINKYTEEEIFNFSPLLINKESKMSSMTEGGAMYLYYSKFAPCDISFRLIEHLYENFNSIQNTFNDLLVKTIKKC